MILGACSQLGHLLFIRCHSIDDLIDLAKDPFCAFVTGEESVFLVQILFITGLEETKDMTGELRTDSSFGSKGSNCDNRAQSPSEISLLQVSSRQRGQDRAVGLYDKR